MDEEMGEDLPAREEEDDESEGDEEFDWIVENDDDDDDEEDDDVEEEEDDDSLVTEQSENFEVDTPPERSGHIAVVDRNCMYVWGGYKVSFYFI